MVVMVTVGLRACAQARSCACLLAPARFWLAFEPGGTCAWLHPACVGDAGCRRQQLARCEGRGRASA
eukprot:2832673-Pleurochrysis_carterae.AAC.1